MSNNSFFSGVKFHDNENFPCGFFHSGRFNIKESEILSDCGFIMHQLAEGNIRACNEEQEHFLLVISGKIKPLYFVEHTYIKYLNLIKKDRTVNKVNKTLETESQIVNMSIKNHGIHEGNSLPSFT